MNVLFGIEGEKLGGAEQDVLRLARELRARGHGVVITTSGRAMRDEARERGFDVLDLPGGWGPLALRALARGCREQAIDLINPHSLRTTWLAGLAVRSVLPRIPVVTTIHNVADRRTDRLAVWILRALPDAVAFVSRFEQQRLGGVGGRVLHTGIDLVDPDGVQPADLLRQHGVPDGAQVIGFVGRLSPEKAIEDAIAALGQLPESVVLFLVGHGPQEDVLRMQAQERGLAQRVFFGGFSRDVPRYLKCFALLVLPSRREALPVVLREAGMLGLATVAADVGGVREIVVHGETGLLYPSGDVPALAAALCELLQDPERSARLGAAARERVVRLFGIDAWIDATLALFEQVAASVGSNSRRGSG